MSNIMAFQFSQQMWWSKCSEIYLEKECSFWAICISKLHLCCLQWPVMLPHLFAMKNGYGQNCLHIQIQLSAPSSFYCQLFQLCKLLFFNSAQSWMVVAARAMLSSACPSTSSLKIDGDCSQLYKACISVMQSNPQCTEGYSNAL